MTCPRYTGRIPSMAEAPETIKLLVQRFSDNIDSYRASSYNEAQLRREFIDPMFKAMGWDVDNEAGHAEPYKDVIHEETVRIGPATKAPDYSFRIGGARKFFLEAKRPAVRIGTDPVPAYQLRRYGWSAKLPLSILTNFSEFAVYDCRIRPHKNDKASTGRTLYLRFTEYLDRWDEIARVFSKEAILKGSFDKYAESTRRKRGTAEVDGSFLAEIESWREMLARNIALRNKQLSVREMNHAVQRTVDRIIFLRICEDRAIENYGRLRALLNGPNTYKRLGELFHRADERYNSGLFHFQRERGREDHDAWTLDLTIDDKVLKEIIKRLYYPESPYEFSVLPADILGQIYERFLGKVIRLTPGHQAKVEEKPEVRKAGGVYYTPTYIVDYIVKNTVGKLCEGKSPKQVAKLRILDPACGSGSFLLGAYQYLLDWHLKWYLDHDPARHAKGKRPAVYQVRHNDWRLTTRIRKEILLNNIFGVDIDQQAVEVTKLSLLLKVLEGETAETLNRSLELFHERALPDLSNNIKCGNSLIGPDFYEGKQATMFDQEEVYRINAFDWQNEFPDVMKRGGFDAVIGNPPYVRQEGLGQFKAYFESHYETFVSTADLYVPFVEKGHKLLNSSGVFGMIVSNKWLRAAYGKRLRGFLTNQASPLEVLDLAGLPVFAKATVRTIILISARQHRPGKRLKYLAPISLEKFKRVRSAEDLERLKEQDAIGVNSEGLSGECWSFSGQDTALAMKRVQELCVPLNQYVLSKPFFGIKTGFNKAFVIDRKTRDALIADDPGSIEIIKPLLTGRDVRRYRSEFKDRYLLLTYIGVQIEKYPAVLAHLQRFQRRLQKRCDKGNYWWELRACDYYDRFEQPKIIYPDIGTGCRFTLDRSGYYSTNTTYFLPSSDLYLLGILNSKFSHFYFSRVCARLEGGGTTYLRFFAQYVERFPVRSPTDSDKGCHDRIVELVERMLDLHKRLHEVRTEHDKNVLRRQIAATDDEIDRLVYELYGLTEREIKIVEETCKL